MKQMEITTTLLVQHIGCHNGNGGAGRIQLFLYIRPTPINRLALTPTLFLWEHRNRRGFTIFGNSTSEPAYNQHNCHRFKK
jgi:hypothetical protein